MWLHWSGTYPGQVHTCFIKANIPLKNAFTLATQGKRKILPNAKYIPLASVGGRVGSGVTLGPQEMVDTNMLVKETQNRCVGGSNQYWTPT